MNGKMRSSVMGLILGQFSSPLPEAQKEPVAYLYNGNSFGGQYRSKYVSNDGTTEEYIDFGKGDFPLAMSTYMSYADGATQGSFPFTMKLTELPDSFMAGQKIEIYFYFPAVRITYASSYTYNQSFNIWSQNADGKAVAGGRIDYDNADGELSYTGKVSGTLLGRENIFADDQVLELLYGDNGEVVGFHLTGTLLYDVTYFSYSQKFSYDALSSPPSGYCYVTFNSADDLQVTVY